MPDFGSSIAYLLISLSSVILAGETLIGWLARAASQ